MPLQLAPLGGKAGIVAMRHQMAGVVEQAGLELGSDTMPVADDGY